MGQIVWPLAVAQTIVWASIFYLFPALLPVWEAETGWSKAELSGAFTLALFASAAMSPVIGKVIDAGLGQRAMLAGSVVGVTALIALANVTELWQFYAVWLVLGLCMAASLYEPCFAIITHHLGVKAKPAITRVTLVAGLAGTVSFPMANLLASAHGWRIAVYCFAAAVALITLPLTVHALRRLAVLHPVQLHPRQAEIAKKNPTRRTFWLLALAFTLIAINHGMIITHLLPLLAERGVAVTIAVLAASMIGPMQVAGRLVMVATERFVTTAGATLACFAGLLVGVSALIFADASPMLIAIFVVLHGASWGTTSILRPVLTRELMGGEGFGLISGRLSGLMLLGTAIAPFGGALLWQAGGYGLMLGVCLGMVTAGLGVMVLMRI